MIYVLPPKGNADTWGIILLEVLCKAVEAVIYNWIKTAVQFHEVFHVFNAHRVMGMDTMKLKIYQEMAII